MAAEEVVHIIHDTAGHHALGSYHPFFTGLEADFQGAGHFVLVGCHQFGYRKADGGVTVMAAGVHQAGVLGSKALYSGPVLFVRVLCHKERVDIKAQGNGITRFGKMHDPHAAGHAALHFGHQLRVRPFGNGPFGAFFQLRFRRYQHSLGSFHNICSHKHFIPQFLQFRGNDAGGAKFRPGCFRVGVQVPSSFYHFLPQSHSFFQ